MRPSRRLEQIPPYLFAELERSVEQGYAVSDEDVTPGIASLGAPIFDYTGCIRAAISLGGMRQFVLEEIYDEAVELITTNDKLSYLPRTTLELLAVSATPRPTVEAIKEPENFQDSLREVLRLEADISALED